MVDLKPTLTVDTAVLLYMEVPSLGFMACAPVGSAELHIHPASNLPVANAHVSFPK